MSTSTPKAAHSSSCSDLSFRTPLSMKTPQRVSAMKSTAPLSSGDESTGDSPVPSQYGSSFDSSGPEGSSLDSSSNDSDSDLSVDDSNPVSRGLFPSSRVDERAEISGLLESHAEAEVVRERLFSWKFTISLLFLLWQMANFVSNNALDALLFGLSQLMLSASQIMPSNSILALVASLFMSSSYKLYKYVSADTVIYEDVVCKSCQNVWKLSDLTDETTGDITKKCPASLPTGGRGTSRPCNEKLFRKLRLKGDRAKDYPKYVYARVSLTTALQNLVMHRGFQEYFEITETDILKPATYRDIKDGSVWRTFVKKYCSVGDYFSGLMINLDWFQPFNRSKVSIGVIYFVCVNLPRAIRFRRENVIVAAVLPYTGREPSNMSPFLKPIVDELLELWDGTEIAVNNEFKKLKAALICVSSDLPAIRKLIGILSHSATKGCSFCNITAKSRLNSTYRDFGTGVDKIVLASMRIPGPQWKLPWTPRRVCDHKEVILKLKKAGTKSAKSKIETSTGFRDSELLRLPYFDSILHHVIDPMHGLWEGIAKLCLDVWIKKGKLNDGNISKIDSRLKQLKIPPNLDRMPDNFTNAIGSMKAIHWCNWVLYYSPMVLPGQLPADCWEYWIAFVTACRCISKPTLTDEDLSRYSYWFTVFLKKFRSIHPNNVTPYMHLCLHLEQCVQRFGPISSFWCFTFERYNGMLGSYPTNRQFNIGLQFLRKFWSLSDALNRVRHVNSEFAPTFELCYEKIFGEKSVVNLKVADIYLNSVTQAENDLESLAPNFWTSLDFLQISGKSRTKKLHERELNLLLETYCHMYPHANISVDQLAMSGKTFSSISLGPDIFTSSNDRYRPDHSYIIALWHPFSEPIMRLGTVRYFMLHSLKLNGENLQGHCLCYVGWHSKPFTNAGSLYDEYSDIVYVFSEHRFEPISGCNFLPVQRIAFQALSMPDPTCSENVVICPILRRFY